MSYKEIQSTENIKKNIIFDENYVFPGLEEELKKFLKKQENGENCFDMQISGVNKYNESVDIQVVNFDNSGITVNVHDFKNEIYKTRMLELNKSLQLQFEADSYFYDFGKDTEKAAKVITDVLIQVYEVFEIDYNYQTGNNTPQGGCMIVFMLLSSSFLSLLFLIIS